MKLKRFHTEIYCPEWTRIGVFRFSRLLLGIKLKPSFHAKNKIKRMKRKYRVATKELVSGLNIGKDIYLDYAFEFYANNDNVVKKVCYRIPLKELDSDLILVISSTGKIVTVYLNNNFDGHYNLKRELYEREELKS